MDEYQKGHLEALWLEEKRLEAAWGRAVWQRDFTRAAEVRAEYMGIVDELQRLVKLPERRRVFERSDAWKRNFLDSGG